MQPLVAGSSNRKSISGESIRLTGGIVCLLFWSSSLAVAHSIGRTESRFLNSTSALPATAEKVGKSEVVELKQGYPVERELAGGQAHTYRVTLISGQLMKAVVEQRGIDVVVKVFGPDGLRIVEVDNDPAGGLESVSVVAEASGEYRLTVEPSNKDARTGRYEIRIEELREAYAKDRARMHAQKAFEEANRLRDQQTAESRRGAIKKYEEALLLWRNVDDKKMEAYTLNELGFVSGNLSESKKALEYYGQAVLLWRDVEDRLNEANTLSNIGAEYWRLGEQQTALEYFSQALPLRRAVGDSGGEAITLNNIGLSYSALGQFQKALEEFSQSMALRRAAGDRLGEAQSLHNIGIVYYHWGEWMKALEYFNQSLPLRRAGGNRQGEAVTLLNIGAVYDSLNEYPKALEYYEQALPLSRATGDRRMEAFILSNTGSTYRRLGQPQKALDYFNQSLSLGRVVEDKYGETYTLIYLGDTYRSLNEPLKAMEYYRQALQLSRAGEDRTGEARTLYALARTESELGNLIDARTEIEAGLNIIESTRREIVNEQQRAPYLAAKKDSYEFYIDLLMKLHQSQPAAGHDAAAFEVSERIRARVLLEILGESRADIRQGIDPVLLEHERSVQQQLSMKSERLTRLLGGKHTEEKEAASRKEVEDTLSEYQETEAQIRAKSPRYAALTQPQPLGLKEIQKQVLDEDTLLLEYALGEDRSYLWAVTPTFIKTYELPKRIEIEAAARRVYDLMVAKADVHYPEALRILSQMLLKPVADQLGRKRLLIVSEGALQYVPFGALPMPVPGGQWPVVREKAVGISSNRPPPTVHRPLVVDHEIVNLPSASVLAVLRRELSGRKPAPKTVAVLADPVFDKDDQRVKSGIKSQQVAAQNGIEKKTDKTAQPSDVERSIKESGLNSFDRLVLSRREAELITALASGQPLKALDFTASRATAISPELDQYQIIHFATHSLLNNQHPQLSGIVLSLVDEQGHPQDGFLRLYEIFNLKLAADLVVLSACQTALGKEIKGEGLVGLTRGFMYAGAPRVVASLWKVSDKATAELMKRFYEKMLKDRMRPAAALRAAQVSMLKEKQWEAAYYWAGFVLQGEWR